MEKAERKNEIETALSMIDRLCEMTDIAIIPTVIPKGPHKGKTVVGVHDNQTGQIYIIENKKGENK